MKGKQNTIWILKGAFIILLGVSMILPFFSVEGYRIIENTTSHLGAQQAPFAWVMNGTFIILGLASVIAGWKPLKGFYFQRAVLFVFGISLVGVAIFQHSPIVPDLAYDVLEDHLHSIFANIVGTSFTLFAVSMAFIEKSKRKRLQAVGIAVVASALSIGMFLFPQFGGVLQRGMFFLSFGWLIVVFDRWGKFINGKEKARDL